jgi:ethanolamine utilization protein EutS
MSVKQEAIQRVIQEYVPGKQLTLAHLIANPQPEVAQKLGLEETTCGAVGILTITPGEAVIIAADVASKAADVEIGFMDRFGGSLVITGDTASVEASLREVIGLFDKTLHFNVVDITRS